MEASSAHALENSDITLTHHNKVPQVMNKAPAVSDYEDYNTQVDSEEAVED